MKNWLIDPEPFLWLLGILCPIILVFVIRIFKAQRKAESDLDEVSNEKDCRWWQEQLNNSN